MTSYDDIIADGNGLVYQGKWDSKDNTSQSGFKLWNFGLKAAPKKGINVAHSWTDEQKWDDTDGYKVARKTATKMGMKMGDAKVDLALAQDKWTAAVEAPVADGDWKVDAGLKFEKKPQKEMKLNVEAAIESPDMSGATTVLNVGFESKSKWNKDKKDWDHQAESEVSVSAGVKYENTLVGFTASHDLEKLGGKELVLAQKDGKNKFWAGYNMDEQYAKAGLLWNIPEHRYTLGAELRWNAKDGAAKGLLDQPAVLTTGGKAVLSDWTTLNWMLEMGANRHIITKAEHKVDPHWKLTGTQSFNMADVGVKDKNAYNLGFDVQYTL